MIRVEGAKTGHLLEVAQRVFARQRDGLTAPGQHLVEVGEQEVALGQRQILVDASGNRAGAVDLLSRRGPDDLLTELAHLHALERETGVLLDDTDDVAFRDRSVETEQQVGRREVEEMQGVGLKDLPVVHQAAHLLAGRRQLVDAKNAIHSLRRAEMMAHRTDSAQALHQHRELPERATLDEALETPELDDVQPGAQYAMVVVEEDGDLAVSLDPGERLDHDASAARTDHGAPLHFSRT